MFNQLLTAAIAFAISIGVSYFTPNAPLWDELPANFGATNFPTSLDSLANPGAGDSVATVSHSAQHSNANDAIEALQAKLGIGASTAVTNSIFVGSGAGTSLFSTYATATNLTATGLGTFGSLISQASSTIVGGLTITGNSTTTNATSTISATTNFSTTTKLFGAGLGTCSGGSSALQWTGGFFSCGAISVSASLPATYATSTGSTSYKVEYVSMTPGDVLMAWASCQRTAENNALQLRVRSANFVSSTTLSDGNPDMDSLFGMWQATTTNTVMMETEAGGCDAGSGLQLMTLLINN